MVQVVDEILPFLQVRILGGKSQEDGDFLVNPFIIKSQGQFVDVVYVYGREDRVLIHIAEQRNFAFDVVAKIHFGAAEDDVRLDAEAAQFLDGMLGGLGFELAGGLDVGHQREVDVEDVVLAKVCRDWEKEALRAEEYGVRVVMIRTGVVLGDNGGALAQMLTPFKLGLGGRLGSGRQYMSWIHIDDLTRIMLYAKENTRLRGPVNAVAPNPVSNREFTHALATVLHRPAFLPVPGFALKIVLGEFADVLLGSQRAIPEVLQQADYPYSFPKIEEALKNLL